MEPEIRYARRSDGARTAYATMGEGPFLIVPPGFLSHLEFTLRPGDVGRPFWEALAARRTLVLYDRHGLGLSDRDRKDFTAADEMLDLYAVLDAVRADEVDLMGLSFGGMVALQFAVDQPERVRRLVLWGTAPLNDLDNVPPEIAEQARALDVLRRADWQLGMRAMATKMWPSGVDPQVFRDFVRLHLESASVETHARMGEVTFNTVPYLDRITAPTLVLHRRGDQMMPFIGGEFLARAIPNARFVPLDGDEHLPYYGDVDAVLAPILDFLPGDAPSAPARARPSTSGTAIILFADIVDSTALTERMGDSAFRDKARALDDALRSAVRDRGGAVIDAKTLGDGILATFPSASQAIAAALACSAAGQTHALPLHLGLHAGDVLRESDNVFGGAVNVAARISALSGPGEVLVSRTVADLARTSAGVTFEDRGDHALKGIEEPQRVYAIQSRS